MSYRNIIFERHGPVAWISLNRPTAMNAITCAMAEEMLDALERIAALNQFRALVITGSGGEAFCAGADLKEVHEWLLGAVAPGKADFLDRLTALFGILRATPLPVIAAVNGIAVAGGLEIVMACDVVIAADTATFGDAHSNFGLLPGAGGAAVLPRKIGINRAKYLLFTGEIVSAPEMMAFGIVNKVVSSASLVTAAQALGERLAAKSPAVLSKIKAVVNRALDQTQEAALKDEMLVLREHLRSADVREGLAAFAEKRNPEFDNPGTD